MKLLRRTFLAGLGSLPFSQKYIRDLLGLKTYELFGLPWKTVYKVVDIKCRSPYIEYLPDGVGIHYKIGTTVIPIVGKIFTFSDLKFAKQYMCYTPYRDIRHHILECKTRSYKHGAMYYKFPKSTVAKIKKQWINIEKYANDNDNSVIYCDWLNVVKEIT